MSKTEAGPVAWYVERVAPGKRDHGMKLGPWWKREQAEEWVDDRHELHALYAHPPAQEQPAPYFNRQAVERAISSAENPAPGTMQLNDGKERVTLPGGTLRRMLAIIDQLATHPTPAERATLKGQP